MTNPRHLTAAVTVLSLTASVTGPVAVQAAMTSAGSGKRTLKRELGCRLAAN